MHLAEPTPFQPGRPRLHRPAHRLGRRHRQRRRLPPALRAVERAGLVRRRQAVRPAAVAAGLGRLVLARAVALRGISDGGLQRSGGSRRSPTCSGDYPGEMRMTAASDLGTEQVSFTWRRMPAQTGGKGSYGHRHKTQEEIYFVASGTLQFKLEDEVLDVPAGTVVRIAPRGGALGLERGPGRRRADHVLDQERRSRGRPRDGRRLLARSSPPPPTGATRACRRRWAGAPARRGSRAEHHEHEQASRARRRRAWRRRRPRSPPRPSARGASSGSHGVRALVLRLVRLAGVDVGDEGHQASEEFVQPAGGAVDVLGSAAALAAPPQRHRGAHPSRDQRGHLQAVGEGNARDVEQLGGELRRQRPAASTAPPSVSRAAAGRSSPSVPR